MNATEPHWTRLGALAARDENLAPFAAGGAVILWAQDAEAPVAANPAGRALLARAVSPLPAPARNRIRLLAGGLAPAQGLRLERLPLVSGLSGLVSCASKRMAGPDGEMLLAIVVSGPELRRLGIDLPRQLPIEPAPVAAEAVTTSVPTPHQPPPPRKAGLRFLWQSDVAGRITSVSPEFSLLAGDAAATALPGRSWAELLARDVHDVEGGLSEALAGRGTWSGRQVLWRTAQPGLAARIELSGFPVLDAGRAFAGYRGFGLARSPQDEAFPAADQAPHDADEAAPAIATGATVAEKGSAHPETPPAEIAAPEAPLQPEAIAAETNASDAAEVSADPVESDPVPEAEPAREAGTADAALETDTAAAADEPSEPAADQAIAATADVPGEVEEEAEDDSATADLAGDGHETDDATDAAAPASDPVGQERPADKPTAGPVDNVVSLHHGAFAAVRPVLEPSKAKLSTAERNAFREIARALGARIAGEDDEAGPRLPPAARLKLEAEERPPAHPPESEPASSPPAPPADEIAKTAEPAAAAPQRVANAHAEILDRLPIAVLVNRGESALYANRTLLDLLDFADLDDFTSAGGVGHMIQGASPGSGAMILRDRIGNMVDVDAVLSCVSWQGEAATLMAFRNTDRAGEPKLRTPEEAEQDELAAEFAAEEEEIAARVDALRLDLDQRESRVNELKAMLDTATDGVVTVDERGRILSLNKSAEALFGYDQREVTGELFTLLFAADSHALALDYLDGLKGGGVASLMNDGREVSGRVRQGGRIPLFMTMGQIAEGPDRKFCAVLRDITAWKKTEGELVEARKAAETASAQKSDVLAKISHEIRTPLNAIIGFAEVMAEERFGPIGNERYKEYLRDIHQSGGYVISLVNDLLDLAKIEAGKLDLDFVSVSLNEIALSTVALLQPEAQRGRVVLRTGLAPKLPPVVADQRSLRQIAINLLSNAVKFTDPGGQVIISTALGDQGEAILRVRDTGIGMDDKEIALALEPFRQVPTTRRSGGTGLGLPLTKALVEANRAAMSITSVKNEGTLVEITFPPQRVLAG